MPRSVALTIVSLVAVSFATIAQTVTNSVSFSGNAYDFALFVATRSGLDLAIDPEVLRSLGDTKIEVAGLAGTNGLALVENQLSSHGFVLHPFALGTEKKLMLLTTTPGVAFLRATDCMRRGDVRCLRGTLENAVDDGSALGRHNAQLHQALVAIARRDEEMASMEQRVQSTLASFQQAKRDLQLAELALKRRADGDNRINDPVVTLGRARFEKATNDAENCWIAINQMFDKAAEHNAPVVNLFDTAYRRGYTTEARFLFEQLYDSWGRLRAMLSRLQQEGVVRSERDLSRVPEEVIELHHSLRRDMEDCDATVKIALAQLQTDPDKVAATFTRAYWTDRAAPLARVGTGYGDLQRSLRALRRVLETGATGEPMDKLDKEFREGNKRGLLLALAERRTGKAATQRPFPPSKLGAARGLSVSSTGGILFPVAVGMEHIPAKPARTNDTAAGFWSSLLYRELESKGYPVAFGDYGEKDSYMLMSAIEAYKWLRSIDAAFAGDVGLKIEFQNLLGGKAGDSAGVAFAAGGYSTLRKTPLRQDVAMTGSIRADGAIKAVGGVPLKLAGAAAADGLEVVIVPCENEPDLLLLPLDQLCRLTIVVADDVRTCLKYATEPAADKPSAEQQEAWENVHRLQQAQVCLRLGKRDAAREILVALAGAPHELYNVRRLLDLMAAQLTFSGETEAAQLLWKQVDEVRTRQLLSAAPQDFQIVSVGGVREAIPERPVLTEAPKTNDTAAAGAGRAVTVVKPGTSPQLVMHLTFDDHRNNKAQDVSGNGNDGRLNGHIVLGAGMYGNAFYFGGRDTSVSIPFPKTLAGSFFTVEACVRPTVPVTSQVLIAGQGNGMMQLVLRPGGPGPRPCFQFRAADSHFVEAFSDEEIDMRRFTHLAGTWDGLALRLFVDGRLVKENPTGVVPGASDCPLHIGGFGQQPSSGQCVGHTAQQFFHGAIDYVRIYNYARSEEQIRESFLGR